MGSKRVAIVGAGASGIVAIKSCLDEGLVPVCFERTDDIGGLWHYTPGIREDQACVMKTTVINTSKEMMAYSDFLIPNDFPNYMHNSKVQEYFKMYVKNFDLEKYIKFKTSVLSVKEVDDFNTTGQWVVDSQAVDEDGQLIGGVESQIFDAVMSCTGHHAGKQIANFPGQENFKGKIVHTHDYKDHRGYEDKRVVVIGIGNSGGDVAVELSRIASQVYLSTRRGSWVINRVDKYGLPSDIVATRRVAETIKRILGPKRINNITEKKLNSRFDHKMYGLEPKHRFLSQHPTANDELPNRIICGSVIIKPNIKCIRENSIEFEDGSVIEDIDVIITAIGYQFGFPYIDEKVIKVRDNVVDLFKYAFPPDQTHPTLAVIGCFQPWGALMPISELQSRWAARVFKGNTKLPSKEDMWIDIRMTQNNMRDRYVASPRHTIQVDWIPFMDQIAEQFGCKPDLMKLFMSDPKLAMKCYFGPCTAYQYRLQGPGQWKGARNAIMTTWDRIYEPFRTRPVEDVTASKFNIQMLVLIVIIALILKFIFF